MTSSTHARCQLLAEKIRRLFETGLRVDQNVRHYLDSTFSSHDVHTLEAVIQDPADCERDPLIELLYFPDESVQCRLEDFLEQAAFTKTDESVIGDFLSLSAGTTCFYFPDQSGSWKIPTPISGALAFLSRLNIPNNLDNRLIGAINQVVPQSNRNRYKVKIRNAGVDMSDRTVDHLSALFLKSDPDSKGFFERLQLVLLLLRECRHAGDLCERLADEKRLYFRQLQKVSRIESLHQNQNIETLMMLGVRSPHVDRLDIAKKIAMIDDIGLAIFGKTVYVKDFSLDGYTVQKKGPVS